MDTQPRENNKSIVQAEVNKALDAQKLQEGNTMSQNPFPGIKTETQGEIITHINPDLKLSFKRNGC